MLSVSLIERTLDTRDYDRLLRGLDDNGLAMPLSLRLRLAEHPAGATGLGLRRLVELTYGPSALSRRLVRALLDDQCEDGTFSASVGDGRDPLLTACALAGLAAAADLTPDDPQLADALSRGVVALASLQDGDGLFTAPSDRSLGDRAATTAFILHLLAHHAAFRAAARLYDAHDWFERHGDRLDRSTRRLWDFARIAVEDSPPEDVNLFAFAG
ncbi:MAG: hypothetical protein AAFX76_03185 [Planctomycetota bacterium]